MDVHVDSRTYITEVHFFYHGENHCFLINLGTIYLAGGLEAAHDQKDDVHKPVSAMK